MFCHITKDELQLSPEQRTEISTLRSLETLDRDLETFLNEFDGDIKKAKFANNVIKERLFNIPIDQVSSYGSIRYSILEKKLAQS